MRVCRTLMVRLGGHLVNSSPGFALQIAATASDRAMAVAFILAWLAEAWLARLAIDLNCYHTISRINPMRARGLTRACHVINHAMIVRRLCAGHGPGAFGSPGTGSGAFGIPATAGQIPLRESVSTVTAVPGDSMCCWRYQGNQGGGLRLHKVQGAVQDREGTQA